MARRKRKEEEPVWEPPEFDEVGYMRKEIENAKIALVVIAWAAVGALLAYLFYALNQPVVGFLLGIFIFAALYFLLPMIGLPIHGFKRRDWLSHASIYFFSWLAFSILLLNAPFGDHTSPVVGSFEVGSFNPGSNLTAPLPATMTCYPAVPGSTVHIPTLGNKTIYVIFRATDNVAVRGVSASLGNSNLTVVPIAGQANACTGTGGSSYVADTYAVSFPISGTTFVVTVTAVDTSGLTASEQIVIQTP